MRYVLMVQRHMGNDGDDIASCMETTGFPATQRDSRAVGGGSSDSSEGCNIKFAIIDLYAWLRKDDKRSKLARR